MIMSSFTMVTETMEMFLSKIQVLFGKREKLFVFKEILKVHCYSVGLYASFEQQLDDLSGKPKWPR